jgi:SOS-response transcriptional repressor LexA
LNVITTTYEREGRPPTLREIQEILGLSSVNVAWNALRRLDKQGLIHLEQVRGKKFIRLPHGEGLQDRLNRVRTYARAMEYELAVRRSERPPQDCEYAYKITQQNASRLQPGDLHAG